MESRQEQAEEERREREAAAAVSADLRARVLERESLLLSRTRVAADLSRATHPRHRAQLEAALAHLDAQLTKLN